MKIIKGAIKVSLLQNYLCKSEDTYFVSNFAFMKIFLSEDT